jgi:hypothetical protein
MGAIAAARAAVAAVLEADASLVDVDVFASRVPLESPARYAVVCGTGRVDPGTVAVFGRRVLVQVWLVSPAGSYGPQDDDTDDVLELVLHALEAAGLEWVSAEPAVWRDTHPAYLIEVES